MSRSNINNRAQQILRSLVERYIQEGQPVGSKVLAQDSNLMLSSASVRSIMADLEAAGYLHSPHTSAGRVPTTQGYRFFVENFLTVQPRVKREVMQEWQQLHSDRDGQALLSKASSLISEVTQLAGIVTLPKREQLLLKQVEFLPLSSQRVLVVLIINDNEVQNRIIQTNREFTRSELEQAGNYLTQTYSGKELSVIRAQLIESLKHEQQHVEEMMRAVVDVAEKHIDTQQNDPYCLSGKANLLDAVDEQHYRQLKSLFQAFSGKRDLLYLLDQCIQADGLRLFIGEESGFSALGDYSLVTAPYKKEGEVVGVLGVVGPTRMRYDQVVSAVDVTARLLSQTLDETT